VKDAPPYRSVVTHGYVVDGDGRKLSKKLGNFITLPELLKKVGADIIRLWVGSENYRQDIRISDEILTRMQDAYRRIRNTYRYMLGNLGDFTGADAIAYDELEEADRWALHRLQLLRERVLKAYETYDFHQVYHAIHNFCAVDMSSFYLDILKDRLYTFAADARERRAGQTAMAAILVDLLCASRRVSTSPCFPKRDLPTASRAAPSRRGIPCSRFAAWCPKNSKKRAAPERLGHPSRPS
jgi:isoleucyl-tRNA synthetase